MTYDNHLCIICNERWGKGLGYVEVTICKICQNNCKSSPPTTFSHEANENKDAIALVWKRVNAGKKSYS